MPYIHFTEEQKRLAASVDLVAFLSSEAHLQISLDQTEKYWYNADNHKALEFDPHEKDLIHLPRQYLPQSDG